MYGAVGSIAHCLGGSCRAAHHSRCQGRPGRYLLAFHWYQKPRACRLYLLHIHVQTELRRALLLSTGGLGLNYAAIQSEKQLYSRRLVQCIREVLRRGISCQVRPGYQQTLARHCAPAKTRDRNKPTPSASSLPFPGERHTRLFQALLSGGKQRHKCSDQPSATC